MPQVEVVDDAGVSMKLTDVGIGYHLPVISGPRALDESFRDITTKAEAREDDIIICAYPKSGTHWVWEMICMLLNGSPDRINAMKEMAMLEFLTLQELSTLPSPRVLNTHIHYRHIPEDFKAKQCKIVYIVRNPKDVAVSFYNHHVKLLDYQYQGDFKGYLTRFIKGQVDYGSWFDYVIDWDREMKDNQRNPAHVVAYEDLQENCLHEIKRLADFLKVGGDDTLYGAITDQCSFDKMKKDKDPLEEVSEWKDKQPGMYRKGKVGDWKNWFTVSQNEMFNDVFHKRINLQSVPILNKIFQE